MKTLYLDCGMGAAGDMLSAALLELLPDADAALGALNALGVPHVLFTREPSVKCGVTGTHLAVTVGGAMESADVPVPAAHAQTHSHNSLADVAAIIDSLRASPTVRSNTLAVYRRIADAESAVHGVPVSEVHFHEVGALDAIADVAAFCYLLERLAPDEIVVSPIRVGSGQVRCAHGLLPVPAPATARLLVGAPIYGGDLAGEFCTPTGAALVTQFAARFGELPAMRVERVGYGMGTRDYPAVNGVRALLGESTSTPQTVLEICCNLDDMTAERIGFAMERLFDAGAIEVFTTPVGMKKSRPGTLLTALCHEADRDAVVQSMLQNTTTLGVRETVCRRMVLDRTVTVCHTPYGDVRRKDASGYGISRSKYEYDDLANVANACGVSLDEAERRVRASEK